MQPIVKPLSAWRRKLVFVVLLLAFLVSLPAFIFYAAGYRYDFSAQKPVFTVTGGLYILAEAPGSVIYINDTEVLNARNFRSASYIQGLPPGTSRIHVQSPGLHTWVKQLMIYPHIVTEVESFNLPLVTQARLVTQYQNQSGENVVFAKATPTPVFKVASTTPYFVATSSATTTLKANQEYVFLNNLFVEKASTTARLESIKHGKDEAAFSFATKTNSVEVEVATSTIIKDDIMLYEKGDDLFAKVLSDNLGQIPHYFCADQFWVDEVYEEVVGEDGVLVAATSSKQTVDKSACRQEIKIDRKDQEIIGFAFHPINPNLVILHLTSGLYVAEIDDRSWQNMQALYLGTDLEFIIYRGGIFVKDQSIIFEVLLDLFKL